MKISYKPIAPVLAMISPLFLAQNVQKCYKSLKICVAFPLQVALESKCTRLKAGAAFIASLFDLTSVRGCKVFGKTKKSIFAFEVYFEHYFDRLSLIS